MMRTVQVLLLMMLLFFCSCRESGPQEKMRSDLLAADRAFSELSADSGMNHAFRTYCDENGVLLRPGSMPVEGKERIVALLNQRADSAFRLTWDPLFAAVSASGELGYTYGTYEQLILETGTISRGTYLSVWRKGSGGWKFVLDTGNEGLGTGPTASWWHPDP